MQTVTLVRRYMNNCTVGYFVFPSDFSVATLEPAWRDNARNVSCIPEGEYLVKYLERSASGKYKKVWHIQNVPKRSGILIHKGNFIRDTHGCPLVGLSHSWAGNAYSVRSSNTAINKMREELGQSDFILKIISV